MNQQAILRYQLSQKKATNEIVDKICGLFSISRHALFCEIQKPFGLNLCQIGQILERDHTSIIHYLKGCHRCDIYNPGLYLKMRHIYLELFGHSNIPFEYGMKKEAFASLITNDLANQEQVKTSSGSENS